MMVRTTFLLLVVGILWVSGCSKPRETQNNSDSSNKHAEVVMKKTASSIAETASSLQSNKNGAKVLSTAGSTNVIQIKATPRAVLVTPVDGNALNSAMQRTVKNVRVDPRAIRSEANGTVRANGESTMGELQPDSRQVNVEKE